MSSSFIGKVVDNYRIIENLGIGGMGVVFKAIHIKLDKLFALKMIAPGLAMNENFIKRFQIEAKALAKFEDPNIVRIYDLRSVSDQWFIVMEYVDGYNLLDLIRKDGAFPLQNALAILKQILTAIGHAHKSGIIHRDLKPNNVMISTDGKVKITDFGLAKDQTVTTSALSVTSGGTLYYMSPEHVRGFKFTDKRSDIYSIGMTFYEMITGTVPFKNMESDFDIRESIIRKEIIRPSVYNEEIPPSLEAIVMKSIAKKPEDRYQSTEEMLRAILDFESGDSKIDSEFALVELSENTQKEKNIQNESIRTRNKTSFSTIIHKIPLKKHHLLKIGIYGSLMIAIFIILFITFSGTPFFKTESDDFAGKSQISITSQPSAAFITIGNDSIGRTPLEDHMIEPGKYSLIISKNNFITIDTNIVLEPGKYFDHTFFLRPIQEDKKITNPNIKSIAEIEAVKNTALSAHIQVSSDPENANVYVNGNYRGKTPLDINDLTPGDYRLELKKEGFEVYSKGINLNSDKNNVFKAILSPNTGGLFVSTQPPAAKILIDGNEVDSITPTMIENIISGNHKIEIQKKGYEKFSGDIEIEKGKKKETKIELVQILGKLSVQVRPWGSIYLNDELKRESADTKYEVTLPAEEYKLTVTHPTLGKWEKTVEINSDNEVEIVVNFNRKIKINITAEDEDGLPLDAEIFIDNMPSGKSTPAEIITREGLHRLTVKKEGYVTANQEDEIFVDNNTETQQKIILKKID